MSIRLSDVQREMLERLGDEPHFFNGPATHVLKGLRDLGLAERTERAHDGGYWRCAAAGAALQAPRPGRSPGYLVDALYGPSNEGVSYYERCVIASQLRGGQ